MEAKYTKEDIREQGIDFFIADAEEDLKLTPEEFEVKYGLEPGEAHKSARDLGWTDENGNPTK